MAINEDLKDKILVRCARHCAVCRRVRPTWLQIHHIVPVSQGGADDEDNLLPICITCHTDVHTEVPFTRRFTANELRMHREQVFSMVRNGTLCADSIARPIRRVEVTRSFRLARDVELDEVAAKMLLQAARSEFGRLLLTESVVGLIISTDDEVILSGDRTARELAAHRFALDVLLNQGLLQITYEDIAEVTHKGFAVADDIESSNK